MSVSVLVTVISKAVLINFAKWESLQNKGVYAGEGTAVYTCYKHVFK